MSRELLQKQYDVLSSSLEKDRLGYLLNNNSDYKITLTNTEDSYFDIIIESTINDKYICGRYFPSEKLPIIMQYLRENGEAQRAFEQYKAEKLKEIEEAKVCLVGL